MIPDQKTCSGCKARKPLTDFHRANTRGDGRQRHCRACAARRAREYAIQNAPAIRRRHRQSTYGLTHEQFTALYVRQGCACGICGTVVLPSKIHVDHDHQTGKVRGLLCGLCNRGLGLFKDSVTRLRAAVRYAKRHG